MGAGQIQDSQEKHWVMLVYLEKIRAVVPCPVLGLFLVYHSSGYSQPFLGRGVLGYVS